MVVLAFFFPEPDCLVPRETAVETLRAVFAHGYEIVPPTSPPKAGVKSSEIERDLGALRDQLAVASVGDLSSLITRWRATARDSRWKDPALSRRFIERLLEFNEPLLAFDSVSEGLTRWPDDIRLMQLKGLSLARSGAARKANQVFRQLRDAQATLYNKRRRASCCLMVDAFGRISLLDGSWTGSQRIAPLPHGFLHFPSHTVVCLMNKFFISYRRKESADFSGRLFDRCAGYFGPDRVFMDVDVLISGADYRRQIGKIIDQCDVLLAIIGQQWTTIIDDSGQRRLDNPDDQLRIEVAAAFEKGIAVVPVLIHGAKMPRVEELPANIAALANMEPIDVQSGLQFNTDIKKLIDQLEQKHGLRHPERRFPLEMILIPLGIVLLTVGFFGTLSLPRPSNFLQMRLNPSMGPAGMDVSLAGYRDAIKSMILYCTIPLGLGPLLIVLGNRWCCLTKDTRRERNIFSSGVGRRPTPKSGKAVVCLGLGLASYGMGVVTAIPAMLIGLWALLDIRQRTGWVRGRSLVVVGLLSAIVGGSVATNLHVSFWQFDRWLSHVEVAEKAMAAGDVPAALAAYQKSLDAYPDQADVVAVSRIQRAGIYIQTQQYSAAVEDLTKVIEQHALDEHVPGYSLEYELLSTAYGMRAEAYNALGENDKGAEDQRRQMTLGTVPGSDNSDIIQFNDQSPAPPAPNPPTESQSDSPSPPAPIIDPNASSGVPAVLCVGIALTKRVLGIAPRNAIALCRSGPGRV